MFRTVLILWENYWPLENIFFPRFSISLCCFNLPQLCPDFIRKPLNIENNVSSFHVSVFHCTALNFHNSVLILHENYWPLEHKLPNHVTFFPCFSISLHCYKFEWLMSTPTAVSFQENVPIHRIDIHMQNIFFNLNLNQFLCPWSGMRDVKRPQFSSRPWIAKLSTQKHFILFLLINSSFFTCHNFHQRN